MRHFFKSRSLRTLTRYPIYIAFSDFGRSGSLCNLVLYTLSVLILRPSFFVV